MSKDTPSAPSFSDSSGQVLTAALNGQPQIANQNNATALQTANALSTLLPTFNPQAGQALQSLGNEVNSYSVNPSDYTDISSPLRSAIEKQLTENVNLNGELNPVQQQNVADAWRNSQSARGGNVGGSASGFQETLKALDYGTNLARQNRQEGSNFLTSGQDSTDIAQKLRNAYLGAKQQGVQNLGNYVSINQGVLSPLTSALSQGNLNSMNDVLNTSGSAYNTAGNIYKTQMENTASPFATAANVFGTLAGGFMGGPAVAAIGGNLGSSLGVGGGGGSSDFFNGGGFDNQLSAALLGGYAGTF